MAPPPDATASDTSEGLARTGKTHKIKAKVYAVEELKKVAVQYISTISTLNNKLEKYDNQLAELQNQLGLFILALEKPQKK